MQFHPYPGADLADREPEVYVDRAKAIQVDPPTRLNPIPNPKLPVAVDPDPD